MYSLHPASGFRFDGDPSPYVFEILQTASGLAAITEDGLLSVFDPFALRRGPLSSISTGHSAIRLLRDYQALEGSIVCTAGEDGKVCIWDLRQGSQVAELSDRPTAIQSLTCSAQTHSIAVGTTLDHDKPDLSLSLWDIRSPSAPITKYREVHSDDMTELKFHPSTPNLLLSGSTDGLVNILDTNIADEDDVVVQAFNPNASIHRAGFLNDEEIFVLTHDEKLAIYSTNSNLASGDLVQDFGDMRSILECQYVANVFPKMNGAGAVIGAGSNEQEMFGLVHLSPTGQGDKRWVLDLENSVGMPGGHGQEIVRSFVFLDTEKTVYTAGEDGCIKSWKA